MNWKCPQCGLGENTDDCATCLSCGYVNIPASVILSSSSTGKRFSMSIDTVVGIYGLKPVVGDEAKYASPEQFRIKKDLSAGHWKVFHMPDAKNPTWVNGTAVTAGGEVLEEGSIITIGPELAKLKVSFG